MHGFQTEKQIKGYHLSSDARNPDICLCENKESDQLRSNDQRLCFRYSDSTISLLHIVEISSL